MTRSLSRRSFVAGVSAGAVLLPLAPGAQQAAGRIWRIGFLGSSPSVVGSLIQAFEQGLRDLGYVKGSNIAIEYRSDDGRAENTPALAAELVRLKVDVMVVSLTERALVAKKATMTIPIVVVNAGDPVASGLVDSLAHPGGNVTGLSRNNAEHTGKNLELLIAAVPSVSRVAVLSNPTNPLAQSMIRSVTNAADRLHLRLTIVKARGRNELDGAFTAIPREHAGAVLVLGDGMFWVARARIAELALARQLPSMFMNSEHVEAGGLLSYAANSVEPYRRAAVYVDKILKGAKPGDLPVEQPTTFELVINLKTAKALGLTIPPSLLLRADQVIE
jgi:putative ABC transport system substrate-binding protein